jgi:hypothetical protein
MKITSFFPLVCLFLSAISGCKKNSDGKQSPPINNAPLVNAGNDTTIYFPVSSIHLNGIASDSDYDGIVEYDWQILSGPCEILMNPWGSPYTTAFGLNVPGVYEFQFSVRDFRNASGHDKIKVTVAETVCNTPISEKILKDQNWVVDEVWGGIGISIDLLSQISAKDHFKQLFIKPDSASEWIPVLPFSYELNLPGGFYYQYFDGLANIFPVETAVIGESPDFKIVYCN